MSTTNRQDHISWWQLAMLMVANKLSMLTTYAPIVTSVPSTRDAWMSAWLAAGTAFIVSLVPYWLLRRHPGQSVFSIARVTLGPWFGGLVNLAFAGLFVYLAGIAIRSFSEVFDTAMIPETPIVVLNSMMTLLAMIGAASGMAVLARLSELVGPVIVFSFLLLTALSFPQVDPTRLLPLFEHGPGPMLLQAITPISVFGEMAWTILLAMPLLRNAREGMKAMGLATLINAFMVSLGAALLVSVMGPDLLNIDLFPTLTVVRTIRLAEFLTRVEWLLASLWMGAMYVKIGLLLYGASRALAEVLPNPVGRYTLPAVGIVSLYLAQELVTSAKAVQDFFRPENSLPSAISLELGLPALVLLASLVRWQGKPSSEKVVPHGD